MREEQNNCPKNKRKKEAAAAVRDFLVDVVDEKVWGCARPLPLPSPWGPWGVLGVLGGGEWGKDMEK
jgi:hypothetical protein